jgi:TetR/AcrR family transcriptional repressor of nem operon
MLRKGYAAAGVDELCRLAGCHKGSFYHYFPSKADLAVIALDYLWTELRRDVFDAVDNGGDPGLNRLRRYVEAIDAYHRWQWAERQVLGSPIGGLAHEMAGHDEHLRAAVRVIVDAQAEYIVRWLGEADHARQITPGDNHRRARDILALVEGALLLSRVSGRLEDFRDACGGIPLLGGRPSAPMRPAQAVAPEFA